MDKFKFYFQDLLRPSLAKRRLKMQVQAIFKVCMCVCVCVYVYECVYMNTKGTIDEGTIRYTPPEESARPAHLPQRQVVFC